MAATATLTPGMVLNESSDQGVFHTLPAPSQVNTLKQAPGFATRAETEEGNLSMNWSYAYFTGNGLAVTTLGEQAVGLDVMFGFYVSPEIATQYAGANVKTINFYNGVSATSQTSNPIKKATVSLYSALGDSPKLIQSKQVDLSGKAWEFNSVELDSPYSIDAEKGFYVICTMTPTSSLDYYMVVDGLVNDNPDTCIVGLTDGKKYQWISGGNANVGDLCMSITIESDDLPTDGVGVFDVVAREFTIQNMPFELSVAITPDSATPVYSIEGECTVPGAEPVVFQLELDQPLTYHQVIGGAIEGLVCTTTGDQDIEIKITKVNGKENKSADASYTYRLISLAEGSGYEHTLVVEEGTGTWCSWCPAGMVFMDWLAKDYPDVIRTAVHSNSGASADPMMVTDSAPLVKLFPYFPSIYVNRSLQINPTADDAYDTFEEYVAYVNEFPAIAEITGLEVVEEQDNSITVAVKARFALDRDNTGNRYGVSFEILEDGVGPYIQYNGYAGGKEGPMGGWENEGARVQTIYNDVLRTLAGGLTGYNMFPTEIKADQEYSFQIAISKGRLTKGKGFYLNALLTDNTTGEIVNARQITNGNTAVDAVAADQEVTAEEWFDLNGLRLQAPAKGICIKRTTFSNGSVRHTKQVVTE